MKIYLDSKDIIDIYQTDQRCSASVFQKFVSEGGHEIVVSSYTILEISAPLLHPSVHGNIMTLLNELEKLPLLYVHPDVWGMELKEALHAFSSKREYQPVIPFVKRFDQTLDLSAKPATARFINYSLAGIVWDLYTLGGLKELDFATPMRTLISRDRSIARAPSLESHFVQIIERNLRDDGLSCSDIKRFAKWIYRNPNRCKHKTFL